MEFIKSDPRERERNEGGDPRESAYGELQQTDVSRLTVELSGARADA